MDGIAAAAPGPATRRAARNAAVATAAELAGKVANLAFTIAVARALGKADFGAFAYALALAPLLETIPMWGFDALLIKRASADPGRLPLHLAEVVVWRTAVGVPLFVAAGLVGIAFRPGPDAATALAIVLAATLVDIYIQTGRAAAHALQRFGGISAALVAQRVATAVFAIGSVVAGFGLVGVSVAYLAGTLVGAVGAFESLRRLGVRIDLRGVRMEGLRKLGVLSIPIGLDSMVAFALFRLDQVLLSAMKGDAALASYAAPYRLIETVLFLTWTVGKAVLPVMSSSTDPTRVRRGVENGVAAVALVYIPFGVGLFIEAEPVLGALFGARYVGESVTMARWLAPSPLLFAIGFLATYGLLARDRRWQIVTASAAAAVVNVGLNLLLIPSLSGTGAAIATTVAYAFEAAILLVMLRPVSGWLRLDRALGVSLVASGAMAVVLLGLRLPLVVEALAGGLVYSVAWYGLARWRAPEHLAVLRSILPGSRRAEV